MPLFLVERNFIEQLELGSDDFHKIDKITSELGADWLSSFLSADKKKTYCLYEARDREQLMEHSKLAGIPADVIVEVNRFWPEEDSEG